MSDWDGDLRFAMPISWVKDDHQFQERKRRGASQKGASRKGLVEESVVRKFRLKNNNSKSVDLRMLSPTPFSTSLETDFQSNYFSANTPFMKIC